MGRWLLAFALVVLGSTACTSKASPPRTGLDDMSAGATQPATIAEAISGQKFTGYVRLSYGEDGSLVVTSHASVYAPICTKAMADGKPPCATVTIELDGEPSNFYVASGWTARPLIEKSAQQLRAGVGFVPGVGGAVTSRISQSSVLSAIYGGLFQFAGAPTPEGCEVLRPKDTNTRIDGRCQPARLDIY